MVMMLRCHHLGLTMMRCLRGDIPPIEPSLADEGASQNSLIMYHNMVLYLRCRLTCHLSVSWLYYVNINQLESADCQCQLRKLHFSTVWCLLVVLFYWST